MNIKENLTATTNKMNRHLILFSSLLFIQIPSFPIKAASPSIAMNSTCKIEREDEFHSTKELQTLVSKITVKVIGNNNGGSGALMGKQGNNYLVITNSHVTQGVNSLKIKTADGKNYSAEIIGQNKFKKSDIVLLKFQSNQNYCLPEIAQVTPEVDTPIMAAGFSGSTGEMVFSEGEVKKISKLKEGYEIGYSSNIEQGMSGGAIINSLGELIGINGRSAYPILNTSYVNHNGKIPSEAEIQEMRKLSWGIPISSVLAKVDGDILSAYKLPLPKGSPAIPEQKYTGWLRELEEKAKQFTVRIDSSSNANGSGIIIAGEGNTYTVLTAAHVVCEREDIRKPCGDFNYEILASDGNKYSVEKSSIKIEEGVDLAVVKFNSKQNYQIATLADYNQNSLVIFTAGYPKLKNNSPWRLTMGLIFDRNKGLLSTNQSDFQNNASGGLQRASSLTGGYELVYTSVTYGGMSGGPVLDSLGQVIGIHGRAEGEKINSSNIDSGYVQIGYSLGIPVSTFLGLVPRLGVKPQKLEYTIPKSLKQQETSFLVELAKAFFSILTTDVDRSNTTASQWLERGNQLWRLGRNKQAVEAFDEAIKQKPSFAHLAFYGKGLALYRQKNNHKQAIAAFEQAVKLKPDFVAAWKYQSIAYRYLNQFDKALFAINKAIQLEPQNPNLYNEKYLILDDLKQYEKAEAAITKAIQISPLAVFYYNRGRVYRSQKKYDLALADYSKAIEINPEYADAYNNRGLVYDDQEKWELALADYDKAIEINPEYFYAFYNRGRIYKSQKKYELALKNYNKAIEINPKYTAAYNNRGLVYDDQEKWELALADYDKAIEINPEYLYAFYNRGRVYRNLKKYELALKNYNKAIELNPKYTDAYNNRGLVYNDRGKWELALADFNKAIEINPEYLYAFYNRGNIYKNQKRYELALINYDRAIEINREYIAAYNNRAFVYIRQKKLDLALADLNKVIQMDSNNAIAFSLRGTVYFTKGDKQKAIQDFQKAASLLKAQGNNEKYQKTIALLQALQLLIQKSK